MIKAIIEMPSGTKYKYEHDKSSGLLKLDRTLEIPIPYNYGYIKDTLAEDNDPLDVFIISEHPILPLTILDIELVGILKCTDNGTLDDKVIAIIKDDWMFKNKLTYDINFNPLKEIKHFLTNYKQGFIVNQYCDIIEAQKIIQECSERFLK